MSRPPSARPGSPFAGPSRRFRAGWRAGAAALAFLALGPALAGESYPFEGTWVRADRVCTSLSPHARTYTGRDVFSAATNSRCLIRRVVQGSGEWELFEECRKPDRASVTERIRMLGPDAMLVQRQERRLKLTRGRRFTRCVAAAPNASAPGKFPLAR